MVGCGASFAQLSMDALRLAGSDVTVSVTHLGKPFTQAPVTESSKAERMLCVLEPLDMTTMPSSRKGARAWPSLK